MNATRGRCRLPQNKELGDRIKQIRLRLGKSQEEFGQLFNPPAPKSAVSRWEHGGSPNKRRLKRIAELGNVSVTYLMGISKLPTDYKSRNLTELLDSFTIVENYINELRELAVSDGDVQQHLKEPVLVSTVGDFYGLSLDALAYFKDDLAKASLDFIHSHQKQNGANK